MRILVCHNFYQQPGGEDQVFASECDLLRLHGHDVATYTVDNDAVAAMSKPALLGSTIWNRESQRQIASQVRAHRAEVVHFHNTFPLISPAAYYAARAAGAGVVQTLHNFRLLCPGANLFRDGKSCEQCVGKRIAWPGVAHHCYRGSLAASSATAATIATHHLLGTWQNAVDVYLAPTEFVRRKFVEGGWPARKLIVKPNFVDPDPGIGNGQGIGEGRYAICVARLSSEKGLETLLEAWDRLAGKISLKIVGDGPLADMVQAAAARLPGIQWLGRRPLAETYDLIGAASMLIFPSNCYETFGRVAAEAFAKGTPVIASHHGAPGEIVADGVNGLLFEPGNAERLATAVEQLFADPQRLASMRIMARREYEAKYTGVANHAMLLLAYQRAIDSMRNAASPNAGEDRQAFELESRRVPLAVIESPLSPAMKYSEDFSPQMDTDEHRSDKAIREDR